LSFFFSTATIRTAKLVSEFLRTFKTHTSRSLFKSGFGSAHVANLILETLAQLTCALHARGANFLFLALF
jgi:hypothetical protein